MSKMQKSILILLAFIAACIFLILFSFIGSIMLQQPQEEVAANNPTATPQPTSPSQRSVTLPTARPTLLPTPTSTRVVSPTPSKATPATTPSVTVLNITPSFTAEAEPVTQQGPVIAITNVNAKDEYVDIRNVGTQSQDITGWILRSEKGGQDCVLSGIIEPGQTLRIWARQADIGKGGFNCGYEENIWNNYESDPAVLYDPQMLEIDRQE